jgi:acyl dehydratase
MNARLTSAAIGAIFEGRCRDFSLARVLAFSGGFISEPDWPHRNLHTDLEKAREAGLTKIIASGTQSEGLLVELLIDLFGARWLGHGQMDVKVINSVYVDDVVQAKAILKERIAENGHTTVRLDAWCEKQDGTKVLVGTAVCSIDDEAAT